MGGSRIIQLGMCPCRFCAEWFGSVGAALTSCAFGKSWDLHSQGSPQQWQCGVHSSLHLSEYVQVWDCLRQMIDAEGRKLLLKNIFLSRNTNLNVNIWVFAMHASFVCQCFQIVNKTQVQSSVSPLW